MDPKCKAVAGAMNKKNMNYTQLATELHMPEARVKAICTGDEKPTDAEFKSLAQTLGMTEVSHVGVHETK